MTSSTCPIYLPTQKTSLPESMLVIAQMKLVLVALVAAVRGDDYCPDDPDWHKSNKPSRDCAWVGENVPTRCTIKGEDKAYSYASCQVQCQGAARSCGGDSTSWFKNGNPSKDCDWARAGAAVLGPRAPPGTDATTRAPRRSASRRRRAATSSARTARSRARPARRPASCPAPGPTPTRPSARSTTSATAARASTSSTSATRDRGVPNKFDASPQRCRASAGIVSSRRRADVRR